MVKQHNYEHFAALRQQSDSNACWEWNGPLTSKGYPLFNRAPRMLAHRAAWLFERGQIPAGCRVVRTCGNKLCVNPGHMAALTRSAAIAVSMEIQGRSKLTRKQVREVRAIWFQEMDRVNAEYADNWRRSNGKREVTIGRLAARYGVAYGTMQAVVTGQSYKHVKQDEI